MRSSEGEVYDLGLAVERTALSWQRTILALVVASAVAARYVSHQVSGLLPLVLGLSGVVSGLFALYWVRRRYRRLNRALIKNGDIHIADGVPLVLVAVSLICVGVLAALYVFGR
ncbi:rhomboid family intramembrane serine protease [Populibacterium corticicola]|uniref:Rhomboid family intramembrane serine protease n=1 Tax=Populibacterium corticicola TaxID=1812826 RepID=A0ABW5XEE7_9MICO